ncbi:hypothetical protein AGMMS50229_21050 [Campylobacterota bacterium]|nr:hypothetical protein AGMMS50229_21050 [Campylobacterota bacterium]
MLEFDGEAGSQAGLEIAPILQSFADMITEIARLGAKKLLAEALECEIAEHLAKYEAIRDEHGHKQIVRNGHCEPRNILTGLEAVKSRFKTFFAIGRS